MIPVGKVLYKSISSVYFLLSRWAPDAHIMFLVSLQALMFDIPVLLTARVTLYF